jgi:hypothetical protein
MRFANAKKFHRKSGGAKPTCPACPGLPWGVPWRDLQFPSTQTNALALRLIAKHFLASAPRDRVSRPCQRGNLIQWSPQEYARRATPQPSK